MGSQRRSSSVPEGFGKYQERSMGFQEAFSICPAGFMGVPWGVMDVPWGFGGFRGISRVFQRVSGAGHKYSSKFQGSFWGYPEIPRDFRSIPFTMSF